VQPAQLLFTATAGGESPSSQLIQVYNIVSGAKSFRSLVSADSGLALITLPRDGTLDPQHPTNIVVQPLTAGLNAGVGVTLRARDNILLYANYDAILPTSNTSRHTVAAGLRVRF